MTNGQMARALGWTGIGLGVAELAMPGWLSRTMGLNPRNSLLRAFGAREILAGIGILAADDPTMGMWARVAGDAIDLAALGAAATRTRKPKALGVMAATVAAISALDLLFAARLQQQEA